ncbi:hypothetical protein HNQ51_003160 [Inhella inkyongensis]|uniref:Uncharacterized protein n=1 Tax=Inhella inkyongensis TaxID=392593 RepID=A0A840S833_9BURK|nr:hypothetical protein [Inhella inkyongensis]MBB5205833.1 hypothetical protein [Inhella inkyongensis]
MRRWIPWVLMVAALPVGAQGEAPREMSRAELAAVKPAVTPERDAVAELMGLRGYFIARMAERCRKELGMPPSRYAEPEESRWQGKNHRYLAAIARYTQKRDGPRDPLTNFQLKLEQAGARQKTAHAQADAALKAAPDRAAHCTAFFADSEAGRLDVSEQDPHYGTLEGLARELFDAREAR